MSVSVGWPLALWGLLAVPLLLALTLRSRFALSAGRRWTAAGIRVCIYSSGSIEAQKLIFGHSDAGDLTRYLSGYFDTTSGPKRAAASYATIAEALALDPVDILFVSDVSAETDAAKAAGLNALLIDRDTGQGDVASLAEVLP